MLHFGSKGLTLACRYNKKMIVRVCLRELLRTGLAIIAAVVISFLLVRAGSGFGVDERVLDVRLGAESREEIRKAAVAQVTPAALWKYARGSLGGDLGDSAVFGRPVAELLREHAPETLPALGIAWIATVGLALWAGLAAAMRPGRLIEHTLLGSSALVLAVPCSVLALLFAWLKLPVTAALVVAVLPQAYRYAAGVLAGSASRSSVIAARSRGIHGVRLWFRHVLLPAAPELLGVMSLTANLLISAAIPIEALTGSSGLGHLVWQAALGRDLPLIAAMTLLVAVGTLAAGSSAEIGAAVIRAQRAA